MTIKKLPTCHRTFLLLTMTINQRKIYEMQAKEIDRIQKYILVLAHKEKSMMFLFVIKKYFIVVTSGIKSKEMIFVEG